MVYSKTGSVRNVEVEFTPDKLDRVKVIITNTTGGAYRSWRPNATI